MVLILEWDQVYFYSLLGKSCSLTVPLPHLPALFCIQEEVAAEEDASTPPPTPVSAPTMSFDVGDVPTSALHFPAAPQVPCTLIPA